MGLFDWLKKKENVDIHSLQQKMYQGIFNVFQKFLQKKWKKVDFHAFYTDDSFGFKFFVLTANNEWEDCFNLYDKEAIRKLFNTLDELIIDERSQLPNRHKWYILNLIFDCSGHFEVSYDYADNVKDDDEKLMTYLLREEKEWSKKFDNIIF